MILGAICGALLFVVQAHASPGKLTKEFHHTYPLSAEGRIELDNINGAVHITAWDQNEVKVDAVKYANTKERLDEMNIEVEATNDFVSIETKYPHNGLTFDGGWHDPGGVEYTLTVPRNARLDEIKLINGSLDIHAVNGEVHASCINGRLTADNLQGRVELSTINGHLVAQFQQLGDNTVELKSVNGSVELTMPSDANADLEASTVSGGIENDFGLHVNHHRWVGHDLRGEIGNGRTRVRLENVNGHIEIRHANDGRAMSPVKDLSRSDKDDDDGEI
jgi:hypothetical protein